MDGNRFSYFLRSFPIGYQVFDIEGITEITDEGRKNFNGFRVFYHGVEYPNRIIVSFVEDRIGKVEYIVSSLAVDETLIQYIMRTLTQYTEHLE